MLETITIVLFNALIYTILLALISLGLNMILGVLRILNIAHGVFFAVGAYLSITFVRFFLTLELPTFTIYLALILAGFISGVIIGFIIEPTLLRRIYARMEVYQLLATYALMLVIEDLIKFIWGPQAQIISEPYLYLGVIHFGGVSYPMYYLFLVSVGSIMLLFMYIFLNKTRLGKIIRATAYDREIALSLGIDVRRVYTYSFVIGTILTTLGGALIAPTISLQPGFSSEYIVIAFAVVVLGGLGDLRGAFLASALIALMRSITIQILPELELAVPFIAMLLVLSFRPEGIFKGGGRV